MKTREVKFTKSFPASEEDFASYHQAVEYLRKHGFSMGSMQREAPIGLVKEEDVYISKWRGLSLADQAQLDGVIRFPNGSPRNGEVVIELYIDFKEAA